MKRFTPSELTGLALAALLFLGGLALIIWPQTGTNAHPTNDGTWNTVGTSLEELTTTKSRVYGVMAMLFGTGLAAMALCRDK